MRSLTLSSQSVGLWVWGYTVGNLGDVRITTLKYPGGRGVVLGTNSHIGFADHVYTDTSGSGLSFHDTDKASIALLASSTFQSQEVPIQGREYIQRQVNVIERHPKR